MKLSKAEKRKIIQKYLKEQNMAENPDDCFCDTPSCGNKIGETVNYSKYDFDKKRPFNLNIYQCNNCGKNIYESYAEA